MLSISVQSCCVLFLLCYPCLSGVCVYIFVYYICVYMTIWPLAVISCSWFQACPTSYGSPPKSLLPELSFVWLFVRVPFFSVEYGEIDRKNNLEYSSHGIAEPPHFEVRLKSCLLDIRLPSNWKKTRGAKCMFFRWVEGFKELPSVVLDVFKVMVFFLYVSW